MGKIGDSERNMMIGYAESGKPYREIARIFNVHHTSVSRLHKKYKITGNVRTKKGTGRKKKTGKREERIITRLVVSGECSNAAELQQNLARNHNLHISTSTIRSRLRDEGLFARIKARKPWLQPRHIRHRLEWAKNHKNLRKSGWGRILWSDESKFKLYQSDGRQWCYMREGENLSKRTTVPTIKHGGGGVTVWGCFSSRGVGKILKIEGNLTAEKYKNILRYHMKPSAQDIYGKSGWIFQQDNDPKHTATIVKNYFRQSGVEVLDWPSQSPDLNPIEHLWKELDRRVRKNHHPTNLDGLWEALKKEWYSIPVEVCKTLVHSMPRRCQAVIKSSGGPTKY